MPSRTERGDEQEIELILRYRRARRRTNISIQISNQITRRKEPNCTTGQTQELPMKKLPFHFQEIIVSYNLKSPPNWTVAIEKFYCTLCIGFK